MSGEVRAPELEAGLGWLNTERALRLSHELRGQVVVLDFWTYCCINCMHILPDLSFLEHKYAAQPVTFIGVHSAKFSNEASTETIRQAILRYEIQHPVVVDDRMTIWRAYAVRSWPTVVVIDSRGYVVGTFAGEGNREKLDSAIAEALAQGRSSGTLSAGPLTFRKEADVRGANALAFPGKVLADAASGRLYVADSNHNRIVIAKLPDENGRAKVLAVVGSGEIGAEDGPANRATFHHPQGMATGQGNLYVADTENHLLRAIDLASLEVTTIVGTGKMTYDWAGGLMGTEQGINSPWDMAIEGSTLYVAMAGTHQIWRIDLPVGFSRALAGNGRENLADGPTETSAFAQPSGICLLNGKLYVADSEVSAIRGIDMASEKVFTVMGEGLFSFGDVDGVHPKAKLQHPLGVAAWNHSLVVADTYNHKIKLVDPAARSVRTLCGTGRPGTATGGDAAAFFEPGGVSVIGDDVYVADTNNHRIVRVNLKTQACREIAFDGLEAAGVSDAGSRRSETETVLMAEPVAFAAVDVELVLDIQLPAGFHLNADAAWMVRVVNRGSTITQKTGRSASLPFRIPVPMSAFAEPHSDDAVWDVTASLGYCTDAKHGVCVPGELRWLLPVKRNGTARSVTLHGRVSA